MDYIENRWYDLTRLAGSLKAGRVTASLFISKLQAYPRKNNWLYVLQEYGRLIKTKRAPPFILRSLQSQPLRRKIQRQLNTGNSFMPYGLGCGLAETIPYAANSRAELEQQEQQEVVGCLNALTNIILVWNTIYQQEILEQL